MIYCDIEIRFLSNANLDLKRKRERASFWGFAFTLYPSLSIFNKYSLSLNNNYKESN
jgi:hypothetical protein